MSVTRAAVGGFPLPGTSYDPRNESEFRAAVERAMVELSARASEPFDIDWTGGFTTYDARYAAAGHDHDADYAPLGHTHALDGAEITGVAPVAKGGLGLSTLITGALLYAATTGSIGQLNPAGHEGHYVKIVGGVPTLVPLDQPPAHDHDDRYYTKTESDGRYVLATTVIDPAHGGTGINPALEPLGLLLWNGAGAYRVEPLSGTGYLYHSGSGALTTVQAIPNTVTSPSASDAQKFYQATGAGTHQWSQFKMPPANGFIPGIGDAGRALVLVDVVDPTVGFGDVEWTYIANKPAYATRWPTLAEIGAAAADHGHDLGDANITGTLAAARGGTGINPSIEPNGLLRWTGSAFVVEAYPHTSSGYLYWSSGGGFSLASSIPGTITSPSASDAQKFYQATGAGSHQWSAFKMPSATGFIPNMVTGRPLVVIDDVDPEVGFGDVDWAYISGKPSTFPPSTHTHAEYTLAAASGYHPEYSFRVQDWTTNATYGRAVDRPTSDYSKQVSAEFKTASALGFTTGYTYMSLLTIAGYTDASGGAVFHQIGLAGSDLAFRYGAYGSAWGSWTKLIHAGNSGALSISASNTGTYGAVQIDGSKGGYSGIYFTGGNSPRYLMVNGSIQGIHNGSTWDWYFNNGVLTAGTVPAARVSAGTFGSGTFTMDNLNLGAILKFTATTGLLQLDTADGADTKALLLTGGGAFSVNRGACIALYGNEYTSQSGNLYLYSGSASGAKVYLFAEGSERMRITAQGTEATEGFRAKGWFGSGMTGLAVEIGTSGGQGYIYAYDRTAAGYGVLNIKGASVRFDAPVFISAAQPLYLDGGGNTYIQESSSDRLRMVVGGGERFAITATSAAFGSGVNVSIPAALSVTGAITEDGVRVAKVVISSSSPSGTYPHGTLWCKV